MKQSDVANFTSECCESTSQDAVKKLDHSRTLLLQESIIATIICAVMAVLATNYLSLNNSSGSNGITGLGVVSSIINMVIFLNFIKNFSYNSKQRNVAYLVILSFSIFYFFIDTVVFRSMSFTSLLLTIKIILFVYSCISILAATVIGFSLSVVVVFICLITPSFYLFYYISYGTAPYLNVFQHIMQSNLMQSIEFVHSTDFALYAILLIGTVSIVICFSMQKYISCAVRKHNVGRYIIFITLMGVNALVGIPPMFYRIYIAHKHYVYEVNMFKAEASKRKININALVAEKKGQGETYVVAIGESLNSRHMSIYNYMRQTTPRLQQEDELLIFRKAYSSFPKTRIMLPLALTAANLYNKREMDYYSRYSILDVLRQSGVETFWLTNHSLYSFWDNPITILAKGSHYLRGFNSLVGIDSANNLDGVMLPYIDQLLKNNQNNNKVIFVHLYGNHKDYCNRFPASYQKFYGELPRHLYGNLHGSKFTHKINCYDNSVLYQDFIMASILKLVQENVGEIVSGFIFFPDNGVDVVRGRGQNEDVFTYDMVDIPMLAWFSDSYRRQYQQRFEVFSSNTNTVFSLDLIYDTLLGLFSIYTDEYNSKFDLSSPHYKPTEMLLLGNKVYSGRDDENYWRQHKISYYDVNNKNYWQKHNIEKLIKDNNEIINNVDVIPHRVNSIGKLKEIWFDGYRSFEIDLFYNKNRNCFLVGNGVNVMTDLCFKDFLSFIEVKKLKKVWLDIKNLHNTNIGGVVARLNHINEVTELKEKFIIEVHTQDKSFKNLAVQGYHTCYSLPISTLKLLKENKLYEMRQNSQKIAKYIESCDFKHLCFDELLLSFVENHLQELINVNVTYHIRSVSNLTHKDFMEQISNKKYYTNSRVRTILVDYESVFHF